MPKLKPLSKDEELSAIPVDEPVLVELEPPATSALPEEGDGIVTDEPEKTGDKKPAAGADDGAAILRTQMEEMQRANDRAAQAERERDEARREAREATTRASETEADLIANGLQGAQAQVAAARAAIKTSFENSDAEGLADAQEKLSRASADIREFERAAAMQADAKERAKSEPVVHRQQPSDINGVIDAMNLFPTERTWLKAHPDALMDAGRKAELDAAYVRATRQGLVRGSDAYFEFIEKDMGYSKPKAGDGEERTSIVSAPVSRDSRSAATGRVQSNQITLSPAEREAARNMGVTDIAYARGKLQLQQNKAADPEKYARS